MSYNSIRDLEHFFKERSFLFVSSRSIHHDDFKAIVLEFVHTILGNNNRINFSVTKELIYNNKR